MDDSRFDTIVRSLASPSRRTIFSALTATLFGGALGLSDDEAAAKRKRNRHDTPRKHKTRHDGTDTVQASGKKKKRRKKKKTPTSLPAAPTPPGCTPESAAQTCAGKCGAVPNNCGTAVDCGSCTCGRCQICQTCDTATGQCVPNTSVEGQVCGPGQVCQSGGTCACDATSCSGPGMSCGGGGTAGVCGCTSTGCGSQTCGTMVDNCGQIITCSGCTGCCDGTTCRTGADRDACGTGGNACQACSGVCGTGNICTSCSPETPHPCPAGMCCADGTCVAQCPDCQECNSAGQCVSDPSQSRGSCRIAAGGRGVCCNGTCCAGCCDANEQCTACLAFITSPTYTGNLGGLTGADAKCQARAESANLPGTYKAWLSNATQSPATRFRCRAASCSAEGYTRVDGVTIANDWVDLTNCDVRTGACLAAAINVTELNQPLAVPVWTNTTTSGTMRDATVHCQNWTNGTTGSGYFGGSNCLNCSPSRTWTEAGPGNCFALLGLYCFQQS
jgi:hypothetical protein